MKRFLSFTLTALLLFSLAACNRDETEAENIPQDNTENVSDAINPDDAAPESSADDSTAEDEEIAEDVKPQEEEKKPTAQKPATDNKKPSANTDKKPTGETTKPQAPSQPAPAPSEPVTPPANDAPEKEESAKTLGDIMLGVFRANRDKTLDEIANACISDSAIQFFPMTAPVEPEFLAEFGGEIDGFESAVRFGPAMGSIAFSGFVFEVSGDANAFAKKLRDSADPRWNICVEAEQTVSEVYGNKVFFLMCPKSLGE